MSTVRRVFPVLLVLFLGFLGFSLALPLFPPLFLDQNSPFLPYEMGESMRRALLGLLFAMYPIGQFFGAPLLGKFSDKYGRKPVLLISLIAIIPCYIGSALSILYLHPPFLFISRFLCGLMEGNIVIAQASISDVSENREDKTEKFGWIMSLSSSAFFFGPLISGELANSDLVSWFHYDTPFWAVSVLAIIGFLTVFFLFKESHQPDPEIEITLKKTITSFVESFKYKRLRALFTSNLFVFLGIFFCLNFFSAYLVNVFGFDVSTLGKINAYFSLFFILSPFLFKKISTYFSNEGILLIGSFLLGISYILFLLPNSPNWLFITLIPMGIFMTIGLTFPAILVSDKVGSRFQGQVLGTNQAIEVFAEALTALIGGCLMAISNILPILASSLCAFIAAFLLIPLFLKRKES